MDRAESHMNKDTYYIDGIAVRKIAPGERSHDKSRSEYKATKKRAIRKNRSKLLSISLKTMIFCMFCLITIAFTLVNYIQIQSSVIILSRQKSELQTQIEKIQSKNETREKELLQSITLDEIREKAIQKGMHPATKGQIIYYFVDDQNYMDQYRDIP